MDGSLLVSDPRIHIVNKDTIGLILGQQYWWPMPTGQVYRPVTTFSFLFNYAVLGNGKNPAGYHVLNFLLHTVNVWLVFLLAFGVFQRDGPAFSTAAIWAVHPIATESVTNVAGRADLLAAMSVLAGLVLYTRLLQASGRRLVFLGLALFAIATLGIFSKENAAVLGGLMLLWDVTFAGRGWRERTVQRAVAYSAAVLPLLLLWWVRGLIFGSIPWPQLPFLDNPILGASFWDGRFTAIKVIAHYLFLLVWPLPLAADRAFNQIRVSGPNDPAAWAALAIAVAIIGVALVRRRTDRVIFWSTGFFAIALFPTSNLMMSIGSIMAERFVYLPSVGFAAAVVALIYRFRSQRAVPIVLCIVIMCCAARTLSRNSDWKDDLTLASADVLTAPDNFRFHYIRGQQLYERNGLSSIDGAISEGERAWEILRAVPPELNAQQTPAELGLYYLVKAELVGPSSAEAHVWNEKALAVLLKARDISRAVEKAFDDAQLAHGKPVTMRVAFQPVYSNLGVAYARFARYGESVESYLYGIELNPATASLYDRLASVYQRMGDSLSAAITLQERIAVAGGTPTTLDALRQIYGREPCAFTNIRGSQELNVNCPVVHQQMCQAWANVAKHYDAARLYPGARNFRQAAERNGCSSSSR